MKQLYQPSITTIGRFKTIKLDSNDRIISGSEGWIFLANEAGTRLGVVTIASSKQEKIKYCDFKDLSRAILRIGALRDGLRYANNPEERHNDNE